MSSAFVRESEGQNLNDVEPTLGALLLYLRRENGGQVVSQLRSYYSDRFHSEVYEMSDGLGYRISDGKWKAVFD